MIYLFLTVISFVMGLKVGSLYHVLKITYMKNQINKENLEDSIKKQYEKKLMSYQRKIQVLEEKLTDLTAEYSEEDI